MPESEDKKTKNTHCSAATEGDGGRAVGSREEKMTTLSVVVDYYFLFLLLSEHVVPAVVAPVSNHKEKTRGAQGHWFLLFNAVIACACGVYVCVCAC